MGHGLEYNKRRNLDRIAAKISDLKKKGIPSEDIIDKLHTVYSISDILESLLDSKYIIKSVLIENIIVVNPQNSEERDGIKVLKELIEKI